MIIISGQYTTHLRARLNYLRMVFLMIPDDLRWDADLVTHLTTRINALSFTLMPAYSLSTEQTLYAFGPSVPALNIISPEG